MKLFSLALMAALALASAACGRENAQLASRTQPPEAPAPLGVELDACDGASQLLTRAACADPDILAMNATLSRALRARGERLSREGRGLLLDGQVQWFAALRISCLLSDAAEGLTAETATCVQFSLFDRLISVASAVDIVGPYTIQRVDKIAAFPAPPSAGRPSLMSYISYPRIDAPDANGAAFNAMAQRTLRFAAGDRTEEIGMYRVAYAGPEIISVQFETYDMKLGDAKPNRAMEALSVVVRQRRRLRADDVFAPNRPWQDFVAAQAETQLRTALEDGCDPPENASKVRDASVRADRWVISEQGLKILYPPYALGARAISGCEIDIAWADAAPFLNSQALAPIGAKPRKPEQRAG